MTNEEKIEYLLTNFDFEKLHDQLIKTGKFKSLIELKEKARSVLNSIDFNEVSYSLSGGFLATHFYGELSLYYTLEYIGID